MVFVQPSPLSPLSVIIYKQLLILSKGTILDKSIFPPPKVNPHISLHFWTNYTIFHDTLPTPLVWFLTRMHPDGRQVFKLVSCNPVQRTLPETPGSGWSGGSLNKKMLRSTSKWSAVQSTHRSFVDVRQVPGQTCQVAADFLHDLLLLLLINSWNIS